MNAKSSSSLRESERERASPHFLRALKVWRTTESMQQQSMTVRKQSSPSSTAGNKISISGDSPGFKMHHHAVPSFLDACSQCDEKAVRHYLEKNITKNELNFKDKTGKTGLSHACANGFSAIVSLLCLREINVNLADNEGNTPLIFASQAGHFDIVSMLLNHFPGVDVDQPNHQGFTALLKASVQGRSKCAKLLLYAGASPFKRDFSRGLCALEWAEYCGRQTCAKTIGQFVEACNMGLICTNFFDATNRYRWKSDTNLASVSKRDDTVADAVVGCMPFNLWRKVRRSLPSSGSESAFSPLQSMEDIGKCLYSPLFPEYIINASNLSLSTNRYCHQRRRKTVVPKLEVTLTSKDDNFFFESPLPFVRSSAAAFGYRKFRSDDYAITYRKSSNE